MRLDDEAVRVAVSIRPGLNLCIPHECRCGTLVDAHGLHAMVCKKEPGKHARHHVLNIIWRAFGTASIPAVKEPSGLCRNDGKRPDGLTLIPWQGAKSLVWDESESSLLWPVLTSTGQRPVWAWFQTWLLTGNWTNIPACPQPTLFNPSLSTTLAGLARQRLHFFLS